ncbi:hypothetical protein OsJ_13060 [Oryza sativa Japonica Group]|uniref:Nudix hydrolase domain-containing protein n=1 Tax=Oryza sativa subsp. japonica TaxID=39947 RepID=B9F6W7_ORYSJ|nr:hypothetical protein OsJ_13060 [Oryza sativa Japonica Group]
MCDLVARTGRHQQRYEDGRRLVAGCIPFRYRTSNDETSDDEPKKIVEVLMINSQSGPGLLFPKGGWENDETVEQAAAREAVEEAGVRGDIVACQVSETYLHVFFSYITVKLQFLGFYDFKSKTHQDACCPEGMCRAAVFALHVKEELDSWPEQSTRRRTWLTVPEATSQCRYQWMQEALLTGFSDWHDNWSKGGGGDTNYDSL